MNLIITLNPTQLFWFLPGGKCHLTSDAPGPMHVDFLSLTKDEQKCIILGGRSKIIDLSIQDTELVEIYNKPTHQPITVVAPIQAPPVPVLAPFDSAELRDKLSTILNKSNNSIKKEIGLLDNPKAVKILLELELQGNNRFKIIEYINSRLAFLENLVVSSIVNDTDENAKIDSVDLVADSMEIVDSEVEIREIPLDGEE